MNYYPFHIGDYASATRHLSWDEDAAFRRLLDVYYTTEKPLSLDLRAVCRLVLATTPEQRDAVEVVLSEFFDRTDDGWVNRRAEAELEAMRDRQNRQREKANKRWDKHRESSGNAGDDAAAIPQHGEEDAVAQKPDAVAMPPTPTPTPTPTIGGKPPNPLREALPGWLDAELWASWKRHRKSLRKPMTADAEKLAIRELERLRADGYEPRAVIENAILKSWQGLYAPNGCMPPARASPQSGRAAVVAQLTGRANSPEVIDVEPTPTAIR